MGEGSGVAPGPHADDLVPIGRGKIMICSGWMVKEKRRAFRVVPGPRGQFPEGEMEYDEKVGKMLSSKLDLSPFVFQNLLLYLDYLFVPVQEEERMGIIFGMD